MTDDEQHTDAPSDTVSSKARARLSQRAIWRLALGMMIAAGMLGWIAGFAPWTAPNSNSDPALIVLGRLLRPSLLQHPALVRPIFAVVWIIYTALGFACALGLATRLSPRMRQTLLLVYAGWLLTVIASALLFSVELVTGHNMFLVRPGPSGPSRPFSAAALAPAAGLWLAWLTALLGGVGIALAYKAGLRRLMAAPSAPSAPVRPIPRGRFELASAALATVGVVVWECGFFTLPWATQGCTGIHLSLNHYYLGTCAGLDSADMLSRWSALSGVANLGGDASNLLSAAAAILANATLLSMLVAVVTLWAVARLWAGPTGARRYGWLVCCLIISVATALLAWQGAANAVAHAGPFAYGVTAPWVYGPGVLVTFAGMAGAALGLAGAIARGRSVSWRARRHLRSSPISASSLAPRE